MSCRSCTQLWKEHALYRLSQPILNASQCTASHSSIPRSFYTAMYSGTILNGNTLHTLPIAIHTVSSILHSTVVQYSMETHCILYPLPYTLCLLYCTVQNAQSYIVLKGTIESKQCFDVCIIHFGSLYISVTVDECIRTLTPLSVNQ